MAKINILSCNVQGINKNNKYNSCLEYLDRKRIDIALLQETHIMIQDMSKLENDRYIVVSSSSAINKTKGVLILISKKLKFNMIVNGNDSDGRITYVKCNLGDKDILLLSVYAPNTYEPTFYAQLTQILQEYSDCGVILGADMNAVISPELDKSDPAINNPSNTALKNLISNHS